jgi:hypothetical protein
VLGAAVARLATSQLKTLRTSALREHDDRRDVIDGRRRQVAAAVDARRTTVQYGGMRAALLFAFAIEKGSPDAPS